MHFTRVAASHGAQQGELVAGARKVVAFVVGAEIDAAEEVVGEETDRKLQRDDLRRGRQQGFFLGREKSGGGGEVALGERGGEFRILADLSFGVRCRISTFFPVICHLGSGVAFQHFFQFA